MIVFWVSYYDIKQESKSQYWCDSRLNRFRSVKNSWNVAFVGCWIANKATLENLFHFIVRNFVCEKFNVYWIMIVVLKIDCHLIESDHRVGLLRFAKHFVNFVLVINFLNTQYSIVVPFKKCLRIFSKALLIFMILMLGILSNTN